MIDRSRRRYESSPIFLHAVNRELHDALNIKVNREEILGSIRIFSMLSVQGLFCNISQVYVVFFDAPVIISELRDLEALDCFHAHSDYPTTEEFRESRLEKYDYARDRLYMFFSEPPADLLSLPLSTLGVNVDTTGYIESQLFGLIRGEDNYLFKKLETNDRRLLEANKDWLTDTLRRREKEALIFDIFEKSEKFDGRPRAIGSVRRALSQAYIGSYAESFRPLFLWGYSGINRFDRFDLHTGLNIRYAEAIFRATGIDAMLKQQPQYGRNLRMDALNTEELAIFREEYNKLAEFFDAGSSTLSDYYKRNAEVRSNIQSIQQAASIRPPYRHGSFRELLYFSAQSLKKTRLTLSENSRKLDEPRLYHIYPNPVHGSAPKVSPNTHTTQDLETDNGRGDQYTWYNRLLWIIPSILFSLSFFAQFFFFSVAFWPSIFTSFAVAGIFLGLLFLCHPALFYRRIAGAGLSILSFGGWGLTVDLSDVEVLGVGILKVSSPSEPFIFASGVIIFLTGMFMDFKKSEK